MKEIHKIKIEPLTAVHIGTGKKLLPLDYTLATPKDLENKRYVKFDSDRIIDSILKSGDKSLIQELQEASASNDIDKLGRFFQECFYKGIEYDAKITREFAKLFSAKKSDGLLSNELEVEQMLHTGNVPYIPGSSVKGAVRTAILNNILLREMDDDPYNDLKYMADEEKQKDRLKKGSYEKKIKNAALQIDSKVKCNDAQKDPFRCLEFTDCKFSPKAQIVGCLKNIKCGSGGELAETGMQIIAESIPGTLLGGTYSAEFTLRINSDLQNTDFGETFHVNKKITIREIIDSCNFFFKKQFEEEYKKFYSNAVEHVDKNIVELMKMINSITDTDNQFIIRLGRWSQIEFVSFGNDFRNPKTPFRRGKVMPYGTTRTVLNHDGQYIPIGWCKCTVESE